MVVERGFQMMLAFFMAKCEDKPSILFWTPSMEPNNQVCQKTHLLYLKAQFPTLSYLLSGYLHGLKICTVGTKLKLQTQLPISSMSLGFNLSDSGIPSQPIRLWLN